MRFLSRLWIFALVAGGCGFLVWTNLSRMQRVEHVSGLAGAIEAGGAGTASGYAQGQRKLIVPERHEESFHWIAQTQQMFARGEARVRQVDYENAPFGRPVYTASPYRWWLGFVAWLEHKHSGLPLGLAVERAALDADPLLHGLLVIGATGFAAWRFGIFAATLLGVGLVTVFPLAAGFLPGAPSDRGLAIACALAGQLALLAGLRDPAGGARWFALAGIAGGLGLWVDVMIGVPVLAGPALGALLWAWRTRGRNGIAPGESALPWRIWALSGATTVLVAYLAEFFPGHWGALQLGWIHPLYGLAWLGVGELLASFQAWMRRERSPWQGAGRYRIIFAVVAVASIPAVMLATDSRGFLALNPAADRLTNLPNFASAANLGAWLGREGMSAAAWAVLLPLLMIVAAGWQLFRRGANPKSGAGLALAFGPVLVSLGLVCRQLDWLSLLDGALLGLMLAAVADGENPGASFRRWLWSALVALAVVPGLMQLWPINRTGADTQLTGREAQQLIERHLAHWLARRSGETGAVVYAAPREMAVLAYYGGLRGLGSYARENRDGLTATLDIAGAKNMAKARALLQAREVKYLVFPSWDPFFDQMLQRRPEPQTAEAAGNMLLGLKSWRLPPWLRPLPYKGIMGMIGGFEGESVLVFEVVEEQPPALAACRLAEYLIETGRTNQMTAAVKVLQNYPGDLGAMVAMVQMQVARKNYSEAQQQLNQVVARLAVGADRSLAWDRRVSLAIILAQGKQPDLAREQARRCLAELNPHRLRTLTDGSLFNLQIMVHRLGLPWPDASLRELAEDLLPPEARARLWESTQRGARP